MDKREFYKAKEEEFFEEEESIDVEDLYLINTMEELLEDMMDNWDETDGCEDCVQALLRMAIYMAYDAGQRDAKVEVIRNLHCELIDHDCENCTFCED